MARTCPPAPQCTQWSRPCCTNSPVGVLWRLKRSSRGSSSRGRGAKRRVRASIRGAVTRGHRPCEERGLTAPELLLALHATLAPYVAALVKQDLRKRRRAAVRAGGSGGGGGEEEEEEEEDEDEDDPWGDTLPSTRTRIPATRRKGLGRGTGTGKSKGKEETSPPG